MIPLLCIDTASGTIARYVGLKRTHNVVFKDGDKPVPLAGGDDFRRWLEQLRVSPESFYREDEPGAA